MRLPIEGCAYSVDASSVIDLKEHYPQTRFPRLWEVMDKLADQGRLFVCEQAVKECHDQVLVDYFERRPSIVVALWDFEEYLSGLQRFLAAEELMLTKPSATKTEADPFVIALALMLDGRDPDQPRRRTDETRSAAVVSEESVRSSVKIPAVCAKLDVSHFSLLQMLEAENYSG